MAPFDERGTESYVGHVAFLLVNWQLMCASSGLWLFFVARHLPAGLSRFLAVTPVAAVLLNATPYLLDRCQMPVLVIPHMTIMSISAFKVVAFGLGRGPLAMEACSWSSCFPQFLVVLSLPIIPTAALKSCKAICSSTANPTTTEGKEVISARSTSRTHFPLPTPTSPTTVWSYLMALAYQAAVTSLAVCIALMLWLPDLIRHWFYTLCLVLSLQAIWDTYGFIAALFFEIEPARSFHNPWMSSTLAEYWARRWNLPVTHMLRVLVYDPIIEQRIVPARYVTEHPADANITVPTPTIMHACVVASPASTEGKSKSCTVSVTASSTACCAAAAAPASHGEQGAAVEIRGQSANRTSTSASNCKPVTGKPSLIRKYAALQASFALSGAWHTLIFYYTTGRLIPHWFAFFSIQAPLCVAEAVLLKMAKKKRVELPHAVAVFLTNFALIAVGSPLFFAPVDWSGLGWAFFDNVMGQLAESEWALLCNTPGAISTDHLTRGRTWPLRA